MRRCRNVSKKRWKSKETRKSEENRIEWYVLVWSHELSGFQQKGPLTKIVRLRQGMYGKTRKFINDSKIITMRRCRNVGKERWESKEKRKSKKKRIEWCVLVWSHELSGFQQKKRLTLKLLFEKRQKKINSWEKWLQRVSVLVESIRCDGELAIWYVDFLINFKQDKWIWYLNRLYGDVPARGQILRPMPVLFFWCH